MWPWGHLAVGYLLCSLWIRSRYQRPPGPVIALALAVGTQFPDLIDKPLAWHLGVLPSGRTGAHSLLIAVPLIIGLVVLLDRAERRPLGLWFGVGYLAHVFSDGLYAALDGRYGELGYLLWPITSLPNYEESAGILAHFAAAELSPRIVGEFGLFALAAFVWVADGLPGLRLLGRWIRRGVQFINSTAVGRSPE